jgi:hypothetical protein
VRTQENRERERGLDAFGAAKTWQLFSVYSLEYIEELQMGSWPLDPRHDPKIMRHPAQESCRGQTAERGAMASCAIPHNQLAPRDSAST